MYSNNRKVLINPQFKNLDSFVLSLTTIFENKGEYIHNGRNKIKVFNVDGLSINVKRYGIPPYFFNRVVYLFFREPKAVRSYDYAIKLKEMGIDSPTPIAYLLTKKGLLLDYCYLVTEQLTNYYELYDALNDKFIASRERILSEAGKFTAKLHKLGICHHDYTPGNILFTINENNEILFSLIDINRMSFIEMPFINGCKNFARIDLEPEMLKIMAYSYADEFNYNKDETFKLILANKRKKSKLLKKVKRFLFRRK